MIFISNDPFRIASAMQAGFSTIPVNHFEGLCRDDYQLSLVEQYIITLKHTKEIN